MAAYQTGPPPGPPPQPGSAAPPVKQRRPASFVLKITAGQAWRTFRLMLTLDILLAALYFALLLIGFEHTAVEFSGMQPYEAAKYAAHLSGVEVEMADEEALAGVRFDYRIEEALGLPSGAIRDLTWRYEPENPVVREMSRRPVYSVAVLTESGRYMNISFDFGDQLGRFYYAMLALLVIEAILFLNQTGATRRAVRRTLAPISQLAATTQSISAEPVQQRVRDRVKLETETADDQRIKEKIKKTKAKARKEAKKEEQAFSGTIKTLNQITAGRLDTRINIAGERRELQGLAAAINSMLDRVDAAYSSQLRFVSDASHELRTPIAVLQGYANLLDRWGKEDPAVLQESIDAIKAEAEGMKALVEQLLFLARSDNNSIAMQVTTLDVGDLAAEVLRETQMVDQLHEIDSDLPSRPLWAEGDTGLLKQALRIFVDNAVKYTPEGERIKISAAQDGDWVRISVTDNGIGIPDEEVGHVMERFYRADESRARATGGTGLGLSIADWIVERHGGHVEILSRQDIGTRLTMVLPAGSVPETGGEQDL